MFYYHDTAENHRRLAAGICRCQSEEQDRVVNLRDLVLDDRLRSVHSPAELLDAPVVNGNDDQLEKPYRFIFAVSQNFEIRIALDHLRAVDNAVKHETLFHNANVLAAGEIYFEEGVVIDINDRSGSYRTLGMLNTPDFARAVLTAFRQNGIPMSESLEGFLEDQVP